MTTANSQPSTFYSRSTLERAERAVRCAPFLLNLFATMRWQGVSLLAIAGTTGIQNRYARRILNEFVAEQELLWLMQVGLLRREVDGQGLTDSFRLTPLGRQLVQRWESVGKLPAPSLGDRLVNRLLRFWRWLRWIQ
ncbi:Npun_F0494 family protein [Leptolyngbya sp. AN02str]|uniref:Npun_F0494 family protein n=1 Tax=Leptolyngbya sp. AN02str TaxID=3423363 RepID=UPI003D31D1D2